MSVAEGHGEKSFTPDSPGKLMHKVNAAAEAPAWQRLARVLPILNWLPSYKRADLANDLTAGTIVAIMLIPQSMAYALLAGLPPQMGLYASLLPILVYAILGTSTAVGMGPVAIVSLMVSSTLLPLAPPNSPEYIGYAIALSLITGVFMIALGAVKAGFFTNFMSHPVIAGFTSAAALVIGFSQLKDLLGIELDRSSFIPSIIHGAASRIDQVHLPTLLIGLGSLALLFGRNQIGNLMKRAGLVNEFWGDILPKAMPLVLVIAATSLVWSLDLTKHGVRVVGDIPSGLPAIALPSLDLGVIEKLVVGAFLIAVVGFLESVSVARTLASKRRQKIVPDQELVAVGAANVASALSGGYPVAGSFSRSVVNFSAGARTQLSGLVTVGFMVVTLLLLTPLLYNLPNAALAAIIVVAVSSLVDFSPVKHMWKYMKLDAVSYLATFLAVLVLGVEEGILAGMVLSIAFFLWRTSQPNLVVLGRLGNTEQFRDERVNEVTTYENVLLLRVDMSLYFANAAYMEDFVLRYVADHPKIEHFVLVCSSVNVIDASALETLESLEARLRAAGITMHLAAVKSSILKRLRAVDFFKKLEPGKVFISTHHAVVELARQDAIHSPDPDPVPETAKAA